MTRDEILKLHELSYHEAKSKLNQYRVLHGGESLADCAFRLRDECESFALDEIYWELYHIKHQPTETMIEWLVYNAKPIHWIQAALLAKEKGETE